MKRSAGFVLIPLKCLDELRTCNPIGARGGAQEQFVEINRVGFATSRELPHRMSVTGRAVVVVQRYYCTRLTKRRRDGFGHTVGSEHNAMQIPGQFKNHTPVADNSVGMRKIVAESLQVAGEILYLASRRESR